MPSKFYLLCNLKEESPIGSYIEFYSFSKEGFIKTECHVRKEDVTTRDDLTISKLVSYRDVGEGEMYKIGIASIDESSLSGLKVACYYIAPENILKTSSKANR